MHYRRILLVPSLALLGFACSTYPERGGWPDSQGQGAPKLIVPAYTGFHGHVMPTATRVGAGVKSDVTPETGTLAYYGGKVVSSVNLYAIYWGSAGSYQAQLDPFLQAAAGPGFLGWLGEYDTPTQNIGGGTFAGSIVDANAPGGTTIDDSQIQAEVINLVNAGQLPAPDGNTAYFFFFPSGVNVTLGGQGSSCSTFCGYHDTIVSGSTEAYYGVLPDPATCGANCDNQGGNYFADLTSVTTHELHELVTDPEVGIAIANSADGGTVSRVAERGGSPPRARRSAISAPGSTPMKGYNVQLEWSDQANACIAPGGTVPDAGTIDSGDDGTAIDSGGADVGTVDSGDDGGGSYGGTVDSGDDGAAAEAGDDAGACAHDMCTTGDPLDPTCDPCANNVCAYVPYCCEIQWDDIGASEVGSYCSSPTCPGFESVQRLEKARIHRGAR